ncbi:DUF433 domain-containing protein [Humibacter ginsenosidimutans]|jgi:uncharacterized protein (DUF433 family)|uniref:DUF433 domain-containing protein n=1 Tax=Humibacter ginsenosidimutans TaxID=2599293 RepID=A0A5B8M931_9MICO|nr:DUF433 domain-containing protein [Humibacter ginsenosidimutans]QDZ15910.1 DUF433 domain-containing protein [Humibacter ginsenosidimutans]
MVIEANAVDAAAMIGRRCGRRICVVERGRYPLELKLDEERRAWWRVATSVQRGIITNVAVSLLDRAIYSYSDVDRLVGLHAGTARRWLEGYERAGRYYEPVLREESSGTESVTWGEMVEARLLAEYRDKLVPVQRLRPAIVRLRDEFGRYPLAHARPFLDVEGRELVRALQDEAGLDRPLRFVVVRNGQVMLSAAAQRFNDAVEYDGGVVARLIPSIRTREVVMDPAHAFGQPAIRNVRTDALAEDYRAGTSREELADLYDLSVDQVDEAIRFELIAGSGRAA